MHACLADIQDSTHCTVHCLVQYHTEYLLLHLRTCSKYSSERPSASARWQLRIWTKDFRIWTSFLNESLEVILVQVIGILNVVAFTLTSTTHIGETPRNGVHRQLDVGHHDLNAGDWGVLGTRSAAEFGWYFSMTHWSSPWLTSGTTGCATRATLPAWPESYNVFTIHSSIAYYAVYSVSRGG